jgi:hypothetical protein
MNINNTFGDYEFPEWVPGHTREIIRDFWGQMGRTCQDWLESPGHQGVREVCHHGPGPNGFGMPPNYATIDCFVTWGEAKDTWIRGRYVHRWNNMGSLIDEHGKDHTVSTGDRWVRVWTSRQEMEEGLS